jgi:hypothetical protein
VEVYAELYASGNGNEEFWVCHSQPSPTCLPNDGMQYYNAANKYIKHLPDGTTFGQGPFREVRILVDDILAGVAFPCVLLDSLRFQIILSVC